MIQCAARRLIRDAAGEIQIKQIVPRRAGQRPRFDLGEVEIAQREDAQRFEQRAGLILQCEHDRRFGGTLRRDRLARQHHEARVIRLVVFNAFLQNLHLVHFRRAPGSDGRVIASSAFFQHLYRARRVVHDLALNAQASEVVLTLRQGLRMGQGQRDVTKLRARKPD